MAPTFFSPVSLPSPTSTLGVGLAHTKPTLTEFARKYCTEGRAKTVRNTAGLGVLSHTWVILGSNCVQKHQKMRSASRC